MSVRQLLVLALVLAACGGTTDVAPDSSLMPLETPAVPSTSEPPTRLPPPPSTSPSTTTSTPAPTTTTSTTLVPRSVAEDARAVVMAGLIGTQLDDATSAQLENGGRAVILFSRNIDSRRQLAQLTEAVACAAGEPVIIAVDQEPGRVARLDVLGVAAPSTDAAADEFVSQSVAMAVEMLALGINLDLAPIADVARGENPVLEGRNLGPNGDLVTERAVSFIEALATAGVGSTVKHFPGHGLSRVDPHREVTIIDADVATLRQVHFPPFAAAIDAGAAAVMVGHPVYESLDPAVPASLSPIVLGMLRDTFDFDGVAITDGLSMAALRKIRSIEEIAVEAIAAGQDLLLADRPSDVPRIVETVEAAIADGLLDRERLAEAANRVRLLAAELSPIACGNAG